MVSESPPSAVAQAAEIRQGVVRLAWRMRSRRSQRTLSTTKLSILAHVHRHGTTTPGELSAAEDHQPQALTRVLAELVSDGLISRARDVRDRRQTVLDVTPAGIDALATEMTERDVWLADALADLTETEREVLRLAGRLMDRIADATPVPPRRTDSRPRATNGTAGNGE